MYPIAQLRNYFGMEPSVPRAAWAASAGSKFSDVVQYAHRLVLVAVRNRLPQRLPASPRPTERISCPGNTHLDRLSGRLSTIHAAPLQIPVSIVLDVFEAWIVRRAFQISVLLARLPLDHGFDLGCQFEVFIGNSFGCVVLQLYDHKRIGDR